MRESGEEDDGVGEELHHVYVLAAVLPRAVAVQIPQVDRVLAEGLQGVHEQREALEGEQQQDSGPCVPEHGETEREPAEIGEQEQQLQRQHASVHCRGGIGRVRHQLVRACERRRSYENRVGRTFWKRSLDKKLNRCMNPTIENQTDQIKSSLMLGSRIAPMNITLNSAKFISFSHTRCRERGLVSW